MKFDRRTALVSLATGVALLGCDANQGTTDDQQQKLQDLSATYQCPPRVGHANGGAITSGAGHQKYQHHSLQDVKDGNMNVVRYCER